MFGKPENIKSPACRYESLPCHPFLKILPSLVMLLSGLAVLFWIHIATAEADTDHSATRNADPLVFLGNHHLPPMNYLDNNQAKGLVVDIVEAMAERMERPVTIILMDWSEAQELVLSGEADALIQINATEERELLYDFSEPLLESEFSIFIPTDKPGITSIFDLRGLTVATEARGFSVLVLERDPLINIKPVPELQSGFKLLLEGSVDAVVGDRWVGTYTLAANNYRGVTIVEQPIDINYSSIAVKKGNDVLLAQINSALGEIKQDGIYQRIIDRWQTQEVIFRTIEQERRQRLMIAGSLAALFITLSFVLVLLYSIKKRRQADEKIRYLSYHDQLTGLYNRHFLEEEMKRLDTERQLPMSIIMVDLNGLKLVNDTYGHQTGDAMLKKAAVILKSVCREEDLLARFGGDEFVLYLPRTPEEDARKICERIEQACRSELVNEVPLSLSTGLAVKISAEQKLSDLLKEAEDSMYRDKLTESRSGKSAIVNSLLQTLAAKSFETEAHTGNMQQTANSIGVKLCLPHSELHRLQLLITLHDIGKINIPEELLTRKGPLSDPEWEVMKKHSETGYRVAKATESISHVAEDILAHHERWDGEGYPQGLKGDKIPLLARITAIADAYEVMSRGRPYKKAMSKSEITAEFKKCSGTQFDPQLVELFLSVMEEGC